MNAPLAMVAPEALSPRRAMEPARSSGWLAPSRRQLSAEEKRDVEQQCVDVLSAHAKSFRFAAVFLGPRQRVDAAIAYAFCRQVDDRVDEAESVELARIGLSEIEEMLLGQRVPSPIVHAYLDLVERTEMGLGPALDLIRGARSDLSEEVKVLTQREFLTYCYRVAGTVGLMMCAILGVKERAARDHAIDLGIAMQITNICRDVLEDAARGRVYLPEERLEANDSSPEEVLALVKGQTTRGPRVDRLSHCVRALLLDADDFYQRASKGFAYLPVRARLSIMVASRLYRQIGLRLAWQRLCNPLLGRVSVPFWEKVSLAFRVFVTWLTTLNSKPHARAWDSNSKLRIP